MGETASTNKSASAAGHRQLVNSLRGTKREFYLIPRSFAAYDLDELYNHFLINAPDFKGNYSLAYGEYGIGFKVGIKVDIGKLICPFLKIQPSIEGNGEKLKESLFIIQRPFPKMLPANNQIPEFKSNLPVCFMTMYGQKYGANLSGKLVIAGGAGIKRKDFKKNPTLRDLSKEKISNPMTINTLGIGASIAFNVGADLAYESYVWEDLTPGWYASGRDQQLKSDFKNSIGLLNETEIIRDIFGWLKHLKPFLYNLYGKEQEILDGEIDDLIKKINDFPTISTNRIIRFFQPEVTAYSVIEKMTEIITEVIGLFKDRNKSFFNDLKITSDREKALKAQVEAYGELLKTARKASIEREKAESKGRDLPDKVSPKKMDSVTKSLNLCFINLSIFSKKATGKEEIWLGGKLSSKAMAGISQEIKIEANFKKTSSRYQTFSMGTETNQPFVFTQDLCINYKQINYDFSARAQIVLKEELLKKESSGLPDYFKKDLPKKMIKNIMTYNATSHYWFHPGGDKKSPRVKLCEGSGISFGCSIDLYTLVLMIKELVSTPNEAARNDTINRDIAIYADQLRTQKSQFEDFLGNIFQEVSDISTIRNLEVSKIVELLFPQLIDLKIDAVLIESSFKFNLQKNNELELKDEGLDTLYSSGDDSKNPYKKMFSGEALGIKDYEQMNLSLETIRLRVRLGDSLKDQESYNFRLGFFVKAIVKKTAKKIISKFPMSFTLAGNMIKRAGNEGVFDQYVHWAKDSLNENLGSIEGKTTEEVEEIRKKDKDRSSNIQENIERSVPPVFLLPHSL